MVWAMVICGGWISPASLGISWPCEDAHGGRKMDSSELAAEAGRSVLTLSRHRERTMHVTAFAPSRVEDV